MREYSALTVGVKNSQPALEVRWNTTAQISGVRPAASTTSGAAASQEQVEERLKMKQPMAILVASKGSRPRRGLPAAHKQQHRRQQEERRQAVEGLQPRHRHGPGAEPPAPTWSRTHRL